MRVVYKELRWRWWVAPLLAVADWSHSDAIAGWAVTLATSRGRYTVIHR